MDFPIFSPRTMPKTILVKTSSMNLSQVKKRNFEGVVLRFLPLSVRNFGVTVLHETLPAHSDTPPNLHKHTWEFVFVLSGRATAYLDKRRFPIKKGDMFTIPAGVYHRFKSGTSELTALSVFSPAINFKNPDVHLAPNTTAGKRSRLAQR